MARQWVILAELYGRQGLTRERYFAERKNVLDTYDDVALMRKFRFPKSSIVELIALCQPYLERRTRRSKSLSVATQVLTALRFYAKGTFQEDSGDILSVSQPAVSQIVAAVTKILVSLMGNYIRYPNSNAELHKTKIEFAEMSNFPNVIGLIDGTHIMIQPERGNDEPLYVCRKRGHSINVQVTTNRQMFFTSIVAKYPGSTHDAFIWRNCRLREKFVEVPPNRWMLGDTGYGVEPWLITPLETPRTDQEERFNASLKKTRFAVENAIGLWKSVFRCIDKSGGKLLYTPSKTRQIIVATAVLHSIRRKLRLPEDDNYHTDNSTDEDQNVAPSIENNAISIAGTQTRRRII